ncbi:hypothetical protein B0H14DRAFT_3439875 [Mycena olivaceomarginata]|nr:hypothetical protein B0H14DRAFT_3439875 [Mycena olivaceomarginata]
MNGTKPRPFGGLENPGPGGYAIDDSVEGILRSAIEDSILPDLCHALYRTRVDARALRLRRLPSAAGAEQLLPRRVLLTTQMHFPFIFTLVCPPHTSLRLFFLSFSPFSASPFFFHALTACAVIAPTPTPASSTSPHCSVTSRETPHDYAPATHSSQSDCNVVFLTLYHNRTPPRTVALTSVPTRNRSTPFGFLAAHVGSVCFVASPPTATVCSAILLRWSKLTPAPLHRPSIVTGTDLIGSARATTITAMRSL